MVNNFINVSFQKSIKSSDLCLMLSCHAMWQVVLLLTMLLSYTRIFKFIFYNFQAWLTSLCYFINGCWTLSLTLYHFFMSLFWRVKLSQWSLKLSQRLYLQKQANVLSDSYKILSSITNMYVMMLNLFVTDAFWGKVWRLKPLIYLLCTKYFNNHNWKNFLENKINNRASFLKGLMP